MGQSFLINPDVIDTPHKSLPRAGSANRQLNGINKWSEEPHRHTAKYSPDGRLFIAFRDMAKESATAGDWVGWVGTYEDIIQNRPGEYRIHFKDNKSKWDSTYLGVEVLPDGTFVTTTYGHWDEGEAPYIVSVGFKLEALARRKK